MCLSAFRTVVRIGTSPTHDETYLFRRRFECEKNQRGPCNQNPKKKPIVLDAFDWVSFERRPDCLEWSGNGGGGGTFDLDSSTKFTERRVFRAEKRNEKFILTTLRLRWDRPFWDVWKYQNNVHTRTLLELKNWYVYYVLYVFGIPDTLHPR